MRYELKAGVQLRAEDVTLIHDDPATASAERRAAVTVFKPVQHALDLQAKLAPPRRPWESANPRMKTSVRVEMPEALHMKLHWIKDNVPNSAIMAVCRRAIETEVARLLALHDKKSD